jgi:SynChlorMet cassette protein ScmC
MAGFELADSTTWMITSEDELSRSVMAELETITGFSSCSNHATHHIQLNSGQPPIAISRNPDYSQQNGITTFPHFLPATPDAEMRLYSVFIAIFKTLNVYAQKHGGMLLHAALAEWENYGVALAGRSGAGKSTASRRLPAHWNSLCDDMLLLLRGPDGRYWAHPCPTLSMIRAGHREPMWPFQNAVPLEAIFFLQHAHAGKLTTSQNLSSIGALVNSSQQILWHFDRHLETPELRAERTLRFNNICEVISEIPAYNLELSLETPFWLMIEDLLAERSRQAP